MNAVKRTRGIRRIIRKVTFGRPVPKYVIAGDRACRTMLWKAPSRRLSGPSDRAILEQAMSDLSWEIRIGFRNYRAA